MGNPMRRNTPKGYNPYELMSGMQKFIRRSMEREALFCAYEMESAGMYPHMRNRLMVTIYEDVGMGNPMLTNSISSHIYRMDEYYKKKDGAWRLVLGNIILMACRGEKTRVADQFVCTVAGRMIDGWRVNFDDYEFVYDMHTRKGKAMGRGAEHFYNEASKIVESEETTDYWQEEIDISDKVEAEGFDVLEDYRLSDAELQNKRGLGI